MITKELLEKLINSYTGTNLASHLYENIKDIENLKFKIDACNDKIDKEHLRHQEEIKKINGEIKEIREKCLHISKTYHGDASGNNDSFYCCDICDKII